MEKFNKIITDKTSIDFGSLDMQTGVLAGDANYHNFFENNTVGFLSTTNANYFKNFILDPQLKTALPVYNRKGLRVSEEKTPVFTH